MVKPLTRRTFVASAAGATLATLAACSPAAQSASSSASASASASASEASTSEAAASSSVEEQEMTNLEASREIAMKPEVEEQEFYCTCSWSCSFCQYRIFTRDGNVSHMLPKPDYDYRTCLKGRARIQRTTA